jgi:uncharacterized membrane protein
MKMASMLSLFLLVSLIALTSSCGFVAWCLSGKNSGTRAQSRTKISKKKWTGYPTRLA